jgi:predicted GNAT family acetyltransferase
MNEVQDNAAAQRFELAVEGQTAFVDYRRRDGVVTMLHAEVPSALSGRGLGSRLVGGALDLVRAQGETVVPRCSFVAWFIAQNPAYQDLLAGASN